uniref:Uncharacterized protein n=1 Tax=Oxyrrhis marina TaxID=2969 RepID=A0A7S3UK13_OXYMA
MAWLVLLRERQQTCREDILQRRSTVAAFRFEQRHVTGELRQACHRLQRSCASRLALLFELDSVDWRVADCDADVLGPAVWEDLNVLGSRLSRWEFEVEAVEKGLSEIIDASNALVA